MQVKTTVTCYFVPPGMTIIKKMDPCDVADRNVKWCSCFGRLTISQNIRYNPEITLIGVYPGVLKINVDVKLVYKCSLFIIQKIGTTQIFIS